MWQAVITPTISPSQLSNYIKKFEDEDGVVNPTLCAIVERAMQRDPAVLIATED